MRPHKRRSGPRGAASPGVRNHTNGDDPTAKRIAAASLNQLTVATALDADELWIWETTPPRRPPCPRSRGRTSRWWFRFACPICQAGEEDRAICMRPQAVQIDDRTWRCARCGDGSLESARAAFLASPVLRARFASWWRSFA
jgi:hypothetical protein